MSHNGAPVRIVRERERVQKEKLPGILIEPNPTNIRHYVAHISGPQETPFAGGVFDVELFMPKGYPIDSAIQAVFKTKIYHPNIDKSGRICLNILKGDWTPAQNVITTVQSIQQLLISPNPSDPLDETIAAQWRDDIATAHRIAREWTSKYAMGGMKKYW